MTKRKSIGALVPMRSGSERIQNKNLKLLAGKPLLYYILSSLSNSTFINQIYVSTDSAEIARLCQEMFPVVQIIDRPTFLATSETPMNEVIEHSLQEIDESIIFQTHSTSPFLKSQTIDQACELFLLDTSNESLFSATCLKERLWTYDLQAINHNPQILLRTQDLEIVYSENSAFYIFEKDQFNFTKNRISKRPNIFQIDFPEYLDLDENWQWDFAEKLLR